MARLLDPVCGMIVDDTALRTPAYDDVAFCAPGCRKSFVDSPDAYPARLDGAKSLPKMGTCGQHGGEICRCDSNHDGHGHEDYDNADREDSSQAIHEAETNAGDSGCCGGHRSHNDPDHSESSQKPVTIGSGCNKRHGG